MNKTEAAINDLIQSEDSERFNAHKFSGKTAKLMIDLHHMAAREDMSGHVYCGRNELAGEFMELILEYRKSVREDLKPVVELANKTGFST